jgi:aldehyde:ferredoxin oxidoreductase
VLKKVFNLREGWTRADDTLPARVLDEPLADGAGAGERLTRTQLDLMIGGYYAARGWTADGLVPETKLREVGLAALAVPWHGGQRRPAASRAAVRTSTSSASAV